MQNLPLFYSIRFLQETEVRKRLVQAVPLHTIGHIVRRGLRLLGTLLHDIFCGEVHLADQDPL